VLLDSSLEMDNSDELLTFAESETSGELAVDVSGLGLDKEVVSSLLLVSTLL
jgi:hypothetical protein